jgi:hypothetical protein
VSQRPTFTVPIRSDPEGYSARNSVSSWRALATRNNLQYWINLCTQHRINWVAAATEITAGLATWPDGYWIDFNDGVGVGLHRYVAEFVHTWIKSDRPAGLDIVIAGLSGPGAESAFGFAARIVPASTPMQPVNATQEPALWESSEVAIGASVEGVIDEQVFFNEALDSSGMFVEHSVDEDGVIVKPRQALLRLEILTVLLAGDEGGITEVLIREFIS